MRQTVHDQLHLTPVPIAHVHAAELQMMSATLEALPQVMKWVRDDLIRRPGKRIDPSKGRQGMTADQVLRALVVKQMNGFSYEQLAFHLADSSSYRAFCRLGIDQTPPKKSTLQSNIKRIRALTWERINQELVRYAAAVRVETGRTIHGLHGGRVEHSSSDGLVVAMGLCPCPGPLAAARSGNVRARRY
jgi:IS5 family transposase